MTTEILQQQIEYYRQRAGEYDEWFYRVGRYDRGAELNKQWFAEAAEAMRALQEIGPVQTALELACGTGIWTRELTQIADKIVALDSSTEVLAINSGKLDSPKVHYWQADLFQWEPEEQYDLVLFTFWLSHVPPELLDDFLSKVYRAVKPGGSCFLVDSRYEQTSTAKDMPLSEEENVIRTRKLKDGTTFKIIKVFYEPEEVTASLVKAGFKPTVATTDHYFIYARGVK